MSIALAWGQRCRTQSGLIWKSCMTAEIHVLLVDLWSGFLMEVCGWIRLRCIHYLNLTVGIIFEVIHFVFFLWRNGGFGFTLTPMRMSVSVLANRWVVPPPLPSHCCNCTKSCGHPCRTAWSAVWWYLNNHPFSTQYSCHIFVWVGIDLLPWIFSQTTLAADARGAIYNSALQSCFNLWQRDLQDCWHGRLQVKFRAFHVGKVVEVQNDTHPAKPRYLHSIISCKDCRDTEGWKFA